MLTTLGVSGTAPAKAEPRRATKPVTIAKAKLQLALVNLGSATRAMPESGNIHSAIAVVNAVNDTVGADDNLSNGWISKFWHHAAHLREVGETLGAADEKLGERDRPVGGVVRDVTDDVSEVTSSGR